MFSAAFLILIILFGFINFPVSQVIQSPEGLTLAAVSAGFAFSYALFTFRLWYRHYKFYKENVDTDRLLFRAGIIFLRIIQLVLNRNYKTLGDSRLNWYARGMKVSMALQALCLSVFVIS
jgi:hypothetical protein